MKENKKVTMPVSLGEALIILLRTGLIIAGVTFLIVCACGATAMNLADRLVAHQNMIAIMSALYAQTATAELAQSLDMAQQYLSQLQHYYDVCLAILDACDKLFPYFIKGMVIMVMFTFVAYANDIKKALHKIDVKKALQEADVKKALQEADVKSQNTQTKNPEIKQINHQPTKDKAD